MEARLSLEGAPRSPAYKTPAQVPPPSTRSTLSGLRHSADTRCVPPANNNDNDNNKQKNYAQVPPPPPRSTLRTGQARDKTPVEVTFVEAIRGAGESIGGATFMQARAPPFYVFAYY